MEAPPQPVPPVAAWDGDNDDDPLGEKAPVQWPYVLDIEEAIDMLEPEPPFLKSQRTKEMVDAARLMRVLEDAIRRGVERPEWLDAPERKPLSALESQIAHLCWSADDPSPKNPYTFGSEAYKTHEIHRAMHVTQHNDVGTRLVDELLQRTTARWSERAAILKRHFPEARLAAPKPQGMKSSDYLPGYKTVHMAFAMLRVLQLWHGASSDIFKKAARSVASGIEKRGLQEVFDDAHTAIMFTTLMCDVNGVLPFECPSKRSFLTTQDRILRNPSLLFACMVDGPAGIHTLKHGSAKLRSSARYMEVMMRFYGKDVLLAFDASLLGLKPLGADGARALQHQRQMAAVA